MKRPEKTNAWNPKVDLNVSRATSPSSGEGSLLDGIDWGQLGSDSGKAFIEDVRAIEQLVLETHPLPLLAMFSTLFGTSLLPEKSLDEGVSIIQAHIEILQAIVLRHSLDEFSWNEHPSVAVDSIGRKLWSASHAFSLKRFDNAGAIDSKVRAHKMISEMARGSTQTIRNWGYSYQTFEMLSALFSPLDSDMRRECGADAQSVLDFWTRITNAIELGYSSVFARLSDLPSTKSMRKLAAWLCDELAFPAELVKRIVRTVEISPDETANSAVRMLCLELMLLNVFTFSWTRLRQLCPSSVSDQSLHRLLSLWSLSFGDLADTNVEHYFLGNPVWKRPVIRLDDETWFIPQPQLFFSFGWGLLEGLLGAEPAARKRYEKRRSAFLEQAIAGEFQKAFPMARLYQGNVWVDPLNGKRFENDLLVIVDGFAIVVEAKSGSTHESALRGAPDRLRQAVQDLIVEPARQSARFENFLRSSPRTLRLLSRAGEYRELDMTQVRHIVSYAITLDMVADIVAGPPVLKATGWIPADVTLTPSMSLSHLQNVFALLEGYCARAHYLFHRAHVHREIDTFADELDLLAVYVSGNLHGDYGSRSEAMAISAMGASRVFDAYFQEKEAGQHPPSARLKLTRWWANMIAFLDKRLPTQWSQIGADLLSVPYSDQVRFGDMMLGARENVKARAYDKPDRVLMVAGSPRRVGIAAVCYTELTREERNKQLENAARCLRSGDGPLPDRVVVIGVDPRIKHIPYSCIALMEFDREDSEDCFSRFYEP